MSLDKNGELRTTLTKKKANKGPYLLGEALGEGAFAKVRLATQIHIKEKCAIKIVDKSLLEDAKDVQRLKKEIKILKSIRHKNIIQLFDIMESKSNLYFVIEYCKGGELFDYIVKNKRLKEGEACIFFQQIINGVDYLHKQGIIHRDLKPENLLLDYKNTIKISDFGLSTFYSKNNFLQTACGTPFYAPPEMLEGLQYNGEASDIWSCGIILYAMLCGTLPFKESEEEIIVKKIKTHDYIIPNYLSKEAQDMLYHILKINPEERFTIDKIKEHPWFNLVKPRLINGISLNKIKIPVDDNILNMVQEFGFDKDECKKLLLNNKFCSLTSIYYLCMKKYVREGGKSVSDLESDLFEEYINDPNNYIQENTDDKNENKNDENKKNNNININKVNQKEIKPEKNLNSPKNKDNINNEFQKRKNNNDKENNENKDIKNIIKEKSNQNEQKFIIIKNNEAKSLNKQNNKITKKNGLNKNNKQNNNKNLKNNVINQDKKFKIETSKDNKENIILKKPLIDSKINSPIIQKTKNFIKHQNNINTIIIKKKAVNKKQNNQQIIKSPDNLNIKRNKINSNSLINSFIVKNKSLENDIHNSNKMDKNKSNKNIKNKNKKDVKAINIKVLENQTKLKSINHSNTITNYNINQIIKNNKITPSQNIESNIQISPKKDIFNHDNDLSQIILKGRQNIKEIYEAEKTALITSQTNEFEKEYEENKFIEGQKPLSVINYIAKKLVASSFCGSFNLQYGHDKNISSGERKLSTGNHKFIKSNGNILMNKESNPINEDIEYLDIDINNNDTINNEKNDNYNNENEDNNNDNYYFKNLISILNQKFKKYATNSELLNEKNLNKEIISKNNMTNINTVSSEIPKSNIITINYQKTKKLNLEKSSYLNNNNININNISKNLESKDDISKNEIDNRNLSPKNNNTTNNIETIAYNIKNMISHYNNFLDISTNYDPGIDSRGNSAIERIDSIKKNELKNFSLSLDKKKNNEKNNYNTKSTFSEAHNKLKKNFNDKKEELINNKQKNMNKNIKNKYFEKKVSINLINNVNNSSKSENKNKKK